MGSLGVKPFFAFSRPFCLEALQSLGYNQPDGKNMTLYHGSNLIVKKPRLISSLRSLDFGPGFYTTSNRFQAMDFAGKVMIRTKSDSQYVSIYNLDYERNILNKSQTLDALKIKKLYMQFTFTTDKALGFLDFMSAFDPGKEEQK
ncbi:DUF3990 domain-containing protein [Leadbettera azotonutricia]|nr:DUF3990 domain-containing protein [Leadbettera azotonutricia]